MVVPLGLIVAVCVVDVLAPPHIHLGPLLVAAPAITVAFAGARVTALMGVLAVAAQVLIGLLREGLLTANIQAQITALVVVSVVCVTICVLRDRRERQLHRVRSVAEAAQSVLLQPLPAHTGPLRIASLYIPAEEEADLGGDLYAASRTDHLSTRLLVGDVRGNGLASISNAALLLGAFRAAAHRQATLPRLAVHLDAAFRWDTSQWRSQSEQDTDEDFATAILLDIPDHQPVVHLINCGHPPPLLLHGTRITPLTPEASHLPIGLGGAFGITAYDVQTFPFEVGGLLLLLQHAQPCLAGDVTLRCLRRVDVRSDGHLVTVMRLCRGQPRHVGGQVLDVGEVEEEPVRGHMHGNGVAVVTHSPPGPLTRHEPKPNVGPVARFAQWSSGMTLRSGELLEGNGAGGPGARMRVVAASLFAPCRGRHDHLGSPADSSRRRRRCDHARPAVPVAQRPLSCGLASSIHSAHCCTRCSGGDR